MNITITFRHVDSSDAIKQHAADKFGKLQRFLRRPMTARVTLSLDKLKHVAETRISSGGEHFEAREATEDMYASIDRVTRKLERQIRGSHGAAQSKKRRSAESLRSPAKAAPARKATETAGSGPAKKTKKKVAKSAKKSKKR
jgi:putative sigma-54 modulation protein